MMTGGTPLSGNPPIVVKFGMKMIIPITGDLNEICFIISVGMVTLLTMTKIGSTMHFSESALIGLLLHHVANSKTPVGIH